jgi:anti-repressor protein
MGSILRQTPDSLTLFIAFGEREIRVLGTRGRPLWVARDVASVLQILDEKPWKGIAKRHLEHVEVGVNGTRQVMCGVDRCGLNKLMERAPDRDAAARLGHVVNETYSDIAKPKAAAPVQTSLIPAPPAGPPPIGLGGRSTMDARALHVQMGVGRDFSNWIKGQIEKHEFVEGVDYATSQSLRSPDSASAKARPQVATEYALTLDAAKRIKTAPNTPEAREVQGRLISAQERFSALLEDDDAFIAEAVLRANRKIGKLEDRLAIAEPKAETLDRITAAESDRSLQTAAREVFHGRPNLGIQTWVDDGLLFRDRHNILLPYEPYLTAGYFRVIVTESKVDGRAFNQTVVTAKGLTWLAARYPANRS